MTSADFSSHVLEGVNYISVPPVMTDDSVTKLVLKMVQWADLPVDMHVLDFNGVAQFPPAFAKAVQNFYEQLKTKNARLVSVNMSDNLAKEAKRLNLDGSLNRIQNIVADLNPKRELSATEVRRLLFKYLAQAAYAAVETTLQSTVACDENYSARAEDVPLDQFDFISAVNVNNDFLKAEFRLCASSKVMERLARAMLGPDTAIDADLMESMALELLNMVYGHAKSNLNDKESFQLPSVIPRLLRKPDFARIKRSPSAELTIMPMVTPMGSFYVEVDFGNKKPS